MFGRRKQHASAVADDRIDFTRTVEMTRPAALADQPLSAREAFGAADALLRSLAGEVRLYLVLSTEVSSRGLAPEWQFLYLIPGARAEASVAVRTGASAASGRPEVVVRFTPFPAPGTPEHTMALSGGTYMGLLVQEAWQARLERLAGLPNTFVDSPDAIAVLSGTGHDPFWQGSARLKGRSLPSGETVWEAVTPTGVMHAPFAA